MPIMQVLQAKPCSNIVAGHPKRRSAHYARQPLAARWGHAHPLIRLASRRHASGLRHASGFCRVRHGRWAAHRAAVQVLPFDRRSRRESQSGVAAVPHAGAALSAGKPSESLVEGIVVGHAAGMPSVKLTPRQAGDFLRYLKSIQRK